MHELFDIIIVGAGPSGSACALALQNSGLKVALIDKYSFPRRKACGDSIPGPAFQAIDYLNTAWGTELRGFRKGVEVHKSTMHGSYGRKLTKYWKEFAYNCKRYDFDNFLIDLVKKQTNTVVFENTSVSKIGRAKNEIHCILKDQKKLKAKLVIGCDGANSIVKRALIPVPEHATKNNNAFAVSSYFTGVREIETDQNEMLHIKKYPNGYFWIFPVGNKVVNAGFGILPNNKGQKEINILHAFKAIIETDPIVSPRFESAKMLDQLKGAPLPFGGKSSKISGNRFMLCGDAASLINPLSGAGIDTAIWSGIYAAEQAIKCFTASNFDSNMMLGYEKLINRRFGKKLRRNFLLMRLAIRYPWIVTTAFKFSKSNLTKSAAN